MIGKGVKQQTTARIDKNIRVVVLGAGFGGLTFSQNLSAPGVQLTVVDRQNHHLFQPLLYQVATAGLSAPEIAQPIRSIVSRRKNVSVLLGNVTGVDLARRQVRLDHTVLTYDYLVLALGGTTSYFGHPEWEQHAPGLKSLDDALRIRRQLLLAFERAEATADAAQQARLMTMVVVGGGATGVELAGAFAELARRVLKRDFRHIDPRQARVILLEAGPQILPQFSARLAAKAAAHLNSLGVEVRIRTRVETIGEGFLLLANGDRIESANIIWAAGVAANPLTQTFNVELDRAGRVIVEPDLSVPGHPEVFVIGDMALVRDQNGQSVPGVSPAAMQMGRHVARIITSECRAASANPSARPAFRYWNKGTMATIGRSAAVAQIGRLGFSGWPAWMAWLLVHLIFLIGFRNRAAVLLQWSYSYFTYKRGARIITGSEGSPRILTPNHV